jgi:hypothetical protein
MSDEDELTPDERLLEETLATLRPAAATLDAGRAMFDARRRVHRTRTWRVAAAIAAGVVVGAWWIAGRDGDAVPGDASGQVAIDAAADDAVEPGDAAPVQLVYRRALAKSVAELEAVLDRQGRATMSRQGDFVSVRLTGSWAMGSNLSTLGEM